MTRAQHQAKPSGTWPALFNEQRATLTAVAEMLLRDRIPPGQIVDQARAALRRVTIPGSFCTGLCDPSSCPCGHRTQSGAPLTQRSKQKHSLSLETAIPSNPKRRHVAVARACGVCSARSASLFAPGYRAASGHERCQYRSTT